ncbi:hypothetical protein ScPMuIL_017682 [Solemya velum]
MSVRTYNPSVRVGNWNEDIQLEEDTLKDFLERRENGQLLYQKRTSLLQTTFKQVDLGISRDGYIHFGDLVNIRCPGSKDKTKHFAHVDPRSTCQLSVNPEISKILEAKKFQAPCSVSGCLDTSPVMRSSLVIKSCDGTPNGEPLRFGQPFHISTLDGEGGDLLLQSDCTDFQKCTNRSRHQEVKLVADSSFLTQWQVLHINPQLRMEFERTPVPANVNLIINHLKTNQNLAVEEEFMSRTAFGSREYEITTQTYLDSHRAEKENNHWQIVMAVPGGDVNPTTQQGVTATPTNSA